MTQWQDWPCCPTCGARRRTSCPICDVSGDDLPLADCLAVDDQPLWSISESDEQPEPLPAEPEILVLCPTCDEAFAPQFYRCCAQCGYDFGEGRIAQPPAVEQLSDRALLVAFALIGLVVAVGIYLWQLFA